MAQETIRVFISSPSDVRAERLLVERVVKRLDREFALHLRIEAVLWEREPLLASAHFQDPANIPPPSDADIVVVILWSRLGITLPPEGYSGAVSGRVPVTGTEWEFEDALAAAQSRGRPELLVYRKNAPIVTELSIKAVTLAEVAALQGVEAFFARWFLQEEGGFRAAFSSFANPAQFEEQISDHLRHILRRRLGERIQGASVPTWYDNPFRGLARFEREHAQVFFGRTRARNELRVAMANQIARGRAFILVVGASGSGKSSLVRAGLLPDLETPGMLPQLGLLRHCVMRPGDHPGAPLTGLGAAIIADGALPELASYHYDAENLASALRGPPETLRPFLLQTLSEAAVGANLLPHAEAKLLVVVDQLEELFTQEGLLPAELAVFLAALGSLAATGLVMVVGTLRSDFFDMIPTDPTLASLAAGDGLYHLLPPDLSEIRQIIQQPAAEAGLRFEADVAIGKRLDEVLVETTLGGTDSLPLLQFILDQLWKRRGEGGLLTWAVYKEFGGLEGAIGQHAEAILGTTSPRAAAALPTLLRALVTVGPGDAGRTTSRSAPLSAFPLGSAERELLTVFCSPEARLFVLDDGAQLRVVHEALLTHWPRAIEQIALDRQDLQLRARLELDAALWNQASVTDRAARLLQAGRPLEEARDLLHRRPEMLNNNTHAFVAASAQLREANARRSRRIWRSVAAVLGVLLVGATGAAVIAWQQSQLAQAQLRETERQRLVAVQQTRQAQLQEARSVASLARQQTASGDGMSGMLLASSVLPGADDRPWSVEAEAALTDGLLHNREIAVVRDSVGVGSIDHVIYSPDGKKLAASDNSALLVWNAGSPTAPPKRLTGHTDTINSIVFSPDGHRLLTASKDKTVRIWDTEGGKIVATFTGSVPMARVEFRPDGNAALVTSSDGSVLLWNLLTGSSPTVLIGPQEVCSAATFSPDGSKIVTGSTLTGVQFQDAQTGKPFGPPLFIGAHEPGKDYPCIQGFSFSEDGSRLLILGPSTAELWNLATPKPVVVTQFSSDASSRGALSPDGKMLALAGPKGVLVWNSPFKEAPIQVDDTALGSFDAIAFNLENKVIALSHEDGTILLDRLTGQGWEKSLLAGHRKQPSELVFSPDGQHLASGRSFDDTLRLWDVSPQGPAGRLVRYGPTFREPLSFSPDGRWLLMRSHAGASYNLEALDVGPGASSQPVAVATNVPGPIGFGNFSPDGRYFVTSSRGGILRLWPVTFGGPALRTDQAQVLSGHTGFVKGAMFTSDGNTLLTWGTDKTVRIWRIGQNPVTSTVLPHDYDVKTAAISNDGRRVMTLSGNEVRLWTLDHEPPQEAVIPNVETLFPDTTGLAHDLGYTLAAMSSDGRRVALQGNLVVVISPDGDQKPIPLGTAVGTGIGLAFSPDGRNLATLSGDHEILIWRLDTGAKDPIVLEGYGTMSDVAFSPDGSKVVAYAMNEGSCLWYVGASDSSCIQLKDMERPIFSPDGNQLRLSDLTGTILWPIPTGDALMALVRTRLTRCLTPQQARQLGVGLSLDTTYGPDDQVPLPPC